MIERKPSDYKSILIWGKSSGSNLEYIQKVQKTAYNDDAPLTAIYKKNGEWATVEQIENVAMRNEMIRGLAKLAVRSE